MELLVVGDPHISHKRAARSQEMLLAIEKAWLARPHIPIMVILGDAFDEHEWIHSVCLNQWHDFIQRCGSARKIIHILGNHEMIHANDYPSNIHALRPFRTNNYLVIDRPTAIGEMAFVPYAPTGHFHEALGTIQKTSGLLFCHQEFHGAVTTERGDETPHSHWRVISGHIHEPMTIDNVWYPGAPAQTNFGEADDKAIYVIETLDNTYRIKEKIKLNIKNFRTIEIPWNGKTPENLDINASYFRFEVTAKRTEMAIFKASKLYGELIAIGKIKMTVLPEEKAMKKEGTTFRQALSDLLKNEPSLKEIAHEIIS